MTWLDTTGNAETVEINVSMISYVSYPTPDVANMSAAAAACDHPSTVDCSPVLTMSEVTLDDGSSLPSWINQTG